MDWVPLQTTARQKGQLVFAMRQSQTPAMTEYGPWGTSTDGYCIGLAATWISFCYEGKAFPVDGSKICHNPPWTATLAQTLSDKTSATDWLDYWKAATSPFQMRLSDGLRAKRNTPFTGVFVHSIVTKAYGCYGITITGKAGAHALAMRHARDNRMHFFDSNFGHFSVANHTRLKDLLDWFWKASG